MLVVGDKREKAAERRKEREDGGRKKVVCVSEKGDDGVAFRKLKVRPSSRAFDCGDFFSYLLYYYFFPSCMSAGRRAQHPRCCTLSNVCQARVSVCVRGVERHRRHQDCEASIS